MTITPQQADILIEGLALEHEILRETDPADYAARQAQRNVIRFVAGLIRASVEERAEGAAA